MREKGAHQGVFRVGARQISISLDSLAEVCVVHGVSQLFLSDEGLIGAMNLRGSMLPLYDLGSLAGFPRRAEQPSNAAILRHNGQVAAVAIDEIVDLSRAKPTPLYRPTTVSTHAAAASLTQSAFLSPAGCVSRLNVEALFALPNFVSIPETRTEIRQESDTKNLKLLIFSSGGARFGVDAMRIQATVPQRAIDTSEIVGGLCLGFILHQGWKVPVVDASAVLGLGHVGRQALTEIAIVRFPDERLLGLAVDSMERIAAIGPNSIGTSSPAVRNNGLLTRVFADDNGHHAHLIDVDALIAIPGLSDLAGLSAPMQPEKGEAATGDRKPGLVRERQRYLVFEAGRRLSAPATDIVRIIDAPRHLIEINDGNRDIVGLFSVEDTPIPLSVLSDQDNAHARATHVLVVGPPDARIGFAVDRICGLKTSDWRYDREMASEQGEDMVQLTSGASTEVLPVADLVKKATLLTGSTNPAADIR